MPDQLCYANFEDTSRLYGLLEKYGKLCSKPNCNQHKAHLNGSGLCFAHQKEKDGFLNLKEYYGTN